ncbi:hypothetical protein okayama3_26010 [Yersinia pseudotuberculosis]
MVAPRAGKAEDESTGITGAAADAVNAAIRLQTKAQYKTSARCNFLFIIDIPCPLYAHLSTS